MTNNKSYIKLTPLRRHDLSGRLDLELPREESVEPADVLRGDIVIAATDKNGSISINSTSGSGSFPLVCFMCSHSTRSKFHNDRLKHKCVRDDEE